MGSGNEEENGLLREDKWGSCCDKAGEEGVVVLAFGSKWALWHL